MEAKLIGIGFLSLILSGLSRSWGVVLLIVGLASFVFRETPIPCSFLRQWSNTRGLAERQLALPPASARTKSNHPPALPRSDWQFLAVLGLAVAVHL